ncbi:MAG: hypothetical protein CME25_08625 [Gemmatimonadetes bacterium]|nr:hypothetical protein [Gemmatimonadota bacterium]|tara:strand:+ start:15691 stop:16794 length:1104 start_codon:yes stop_codon:yes gene_type:complete
MSKDYKRKFVKGMKSIESFLDPNQVGFLILYVTNRCNFRCDFCFYYAEIEKGRKVDELTFRELEKVSRKFGPLLQLSLTGGEPFIREDLAEIAGLFIENNHVRYLTIPTNAYMTTKMVQFLETVLPMYPDTHFRITFSIDGIEEEHDLNRSKPGSYKKIQESYSVISPMRKIYSNLVLDSNSVYTAQTEHRLLNIVKHIHGNFDFDNISITYARGEIQDPKLKLVSAERYVKINDYLDGIKRTQENRFLYPVWRGARDVSREALIKTVFEDQFVTPCVAGRKLVILSETGEVYPCEILQGTMGNIRNHDFDIRKVLAKQESKKLVKWIKDSKCKCSFECALAANVLWNPSSYAKLAKSAFKNIGKAE